MPRDPGPSNTPRSRFAGLVVASLVLPAGVPALLHATPTLVYETSLVANPPLERPVSVTLDPVAQEVCVTDGKAVTFNVFDGNGHHRYQTDATSALVSPRDACIDQEGGFVFTDVEGRFRTIRRLSFLGEPRAYEPEWPEEEWTPRHLIVTRDGHYVTLAPSSLLAKHDSGTGELIWKRMLVLDGSERADLLGRPAEAADGTILVPSGRDGVVFVVSAGGKSQTAFGRKGVKPGELSLPVAVTVAPQGMILVLDRMKHKVIIFDAEHTFLNEYGAVGFVPGTFYSPVGIAAAPDGRVFIAQGYEGWVQVFRLTDVAPE